MNVSLEEGRQGPDAAARQRALALTTRSVPPRESLDFWQDAVLGTVPGPDIEIDGRTIDAAMAPHRLGALQITTVESGPDRIHRAPHFIARGDGQDVFVVLQNTGRATVEQDRRTIELRAGHIGFFDAVRPYRTTFPERFRQRVFAIPRSLLELSEADLEQLTPQVLRPTGGLAALLRSLLERLADTSEAYASPVAERMAESVINLVAATAAQQLGEGPAELPGADQVLLRRIRTFVRWHLSDPGLTPQVVARANGVSVRYLHRLFEAEDTTLCQWIRELRLQECRRELAARAPGSVSLGQVARRWGFTSPACFSKAFRSSFGQSPTDWLDREHAGRGAGQVRC